MFLKRLEILGFKSFADKTVIEFNSGITALLGPNGCGKSNIVDAIKWVLGEQSVKNMRAERMEDVIFSGTETRKALSVAEVTLVIANDEGVLEIERPEIAIKRRIFRDGESEYFLNGTPVRLKEIRELFFDTGIGKSAYSVMEQGKIDQVLSNRPEERRYIFEEAAGITKYKMRGSEAERKLARTEENMGQVENILHEVRRNYESLKKQNSKTLEYRKIKDIIFGLERDLKLLQWRILEENLDKNNKRLAEKEKKYSEITEKISSIKETLANELDSLNEMESRLIENQKRLYGMDLEKENIEEQIKTINERISDSLESVQSAKSRETKVLDVLKSLKEQEKNRKKDLDAFKDRLKEIEVNILTLQKSVDSVDERIRGIAVETEDVNRQLAVEEEKREEFQEKIRNITDDIAAILDKGLKESGFDRKTRKNLEQLIEKALRETVIRAEGRASLLGDQKSFSDEETAVKLLEGAAADFTEIKDSLENISALFEKYKNSGADFLEEFLAPEGIITRKRELDGKLEASLEKTRGLKQKLKHLTEESETLTGKLKDSRNSLEELRVAQARTTTQAAAVEDAVNALLKQLESEENRLAEIREEVAQEEKKITEFKKQISRLLEKRETLEKNQEKLRGEMQNLENGISSENDKMAGREVKLKVLGEQKSSLELDKEKIRLEINHINEEIKKLLEDFAERNSVDLRDFSDKKNAIKETPGEIREKLSEAKNSLRSLGQVNLMAPEEFKEVSERYDFLNNQLEDLRKAKENLSRITEEIKKESAELFLKTYREIREHFHEMFRRLFGGGRAEIRLVDHEDPLNSGIEIYAQPPGKKLENISLLSGGEKSLCGVALMFATFQVKPSPFCILDEIDAALDEANIQRFVNVLVEFGEKSQFVVITHNKKTVSGAKTLLGVTMQESGVSRLIALRLDGKEQSNEKSAESD